MELKLTEKQISKIKYECDLLRMNMEQLYHIAPHMFEQYTSKSTAKPVPLEPTKDEVTEEKQTDSTGYPDYHSDDYPYWENS